MNLNLEPKESVHILEDWHLLSWDGYHCLLKSCALDKVQTKPKMINRKEKQWFNFTSHVTSRMHTCTCSIKYLPWVHFPCIGMLLHPLALHLLLLMSVQLLGMQKWLKLGSNLGGGREREGGGGLEVAASRLSLWGQRCGYARVKRAYVARVERASEAFTLLPKREPARRLG